jgi:hypothetical protein
MHPSCIHLLLPPSANQLHLPTPSTGLLSDFGAIFVTTRPGGSHHDCVVSYGVEKCTVGALVSHNVIHNVRHFDHSGAGLYTDESSSGTNLTHNLVFDCGGWGVHLHCGQKHSVVNNIFAGNAAQLPVVGATKASKDYGLEPFCNFRSHNTSVQVQHCPQYTAHTT